MRLIHLTDPHLSTLEDVRFSGLRGKRWSGYLSWSRNRRNKYLPEVLGRLCDAVKAERADQILLTGDLIHIGLESEIEQAARWLDDLGSPERVMLVPGNHDCYARGSAEVIHRAWGRYLFGDAGETGTHGDFPTGRRLNGLSLIGLSTACVTPVFMARGRLTDDQLEKLGAALKRAASEKRLACLLIHHPPLPGMTSWRKGLAQAGSLQEVLEKHPPPLIFHGHLHHNREQLWGDTRIYCTAAASSIGDASYRVIDIDSNGRFHDVHMTLKSIALDKGGVPEFVTVDKQSWQVHMQ